MTWDEFQGHINDYENLGSAPLSVRLVVFIVVFVAIGFGGWWFIIKPAYEGYERIQADERKLFTEFQGKQERAANLEAYREQLEEIERIIDQLQQQFPNESDMPQVLDDISQNAIEAGITVELFEPQPEIGRQFFAETPIRVRMIGEYHQFGDFVSTIASLQRIVILTMHDITLQPVEDGAEDLRLEGVIRTYRYVDESENAEEGA